MDIDVFLDTFYKTLSFGFGEKFKSQAFRRLFLPNASLLEARDGVYVRIDLERHIAEFEDAIENRPQLFKNGFLEKQLSRTVIQSGACFLVSSIYHKSYAGIEETGINNMIIVPRDQQFQIASILW